MASPEPPVAGSPEALDQIAGFLERNCSECHSDVEPEGFGGAIELSNLINSGQIISGAGDISGLVSRLRYGDSLPGHAQLAVSGEETTQLARLIDEYEGAEQPCAPPPFVDRDALYAAMLDDIRQQPPEDRPFVRYLGLTYATNAGACGSRYFGLTSLASELVNGLSLEPTITAPRSLPNALGSELVYAIDLRDYGWSRPLDADGDGDAEVADAWQAIAAEIGAYALELTGVEADELAAHTQSATPYAPLNAVVSAVATGPLYYALTGLGNDAFEAAVRLGVDLPADGTDAGLQRAGLVASRSMPARVATRLEQSAFPGRAYWLLEDVPTESAGAASAPFADPLRFGAEGHQIIFQLPNGLQAYAIASNDGATISEIPSCFGCSDPRALNAVTCQLCHGSGLLAMQDQVRPFALANPDLYPIADRARIQAEYLPAEELGALLEQDSQRHLAAREAAGVSAGTPNVIPGVFYEFLRRALGPEEAAAELGVSEAQLRQALLRLDPEQGSDDERGIKRSLRGLDTDAGVVSREAFTSGYAALSCAIDGVRNRSARCP
jgi:hypothetical protein